MNKTAIEYLDYSWSPIAMRCTPVSDGCTNCWHRRMADRLAGNKNFPEDIRKAYAGEGPPVLVESRLAEPIRRKKPARIGAQFMGDLWHEDVPFSLVDRVFATMSKAKFHTFCVLTKRAKRMFDYFYGENITDYCDIKNVWLGVSVENQEAADERIPLLLQTPAAVRFVSCEPLLSSVDLLPWLRPYPNCGNVAEDGTCANSLNPTPECNIASCPMTDIHQGISWCIVGGESGPGARPMHPDWAQSIRDECQAAGIPYFHKQNGEWLPGCKRLLEEGYGKVWAVCPSNQNDKQPQIMWRVGRKRAGHLLDRKEWREFPNEAISRATRTDRRWL